MITVPVIMTPTKPTTAITMIIVGESFEAIIAGDYHTVDNCRTENEGGS